MLRRVLLVGQLTVTVALSSCSDDDGPGQFRYPMKPGTTWYYTRTLTRVTDSSSYLDFSMQTVVGVGERRSFGTSGTATAFDISEDGHYYGAQYIQNRDEGLYSLGRCGDGPFAYPKLARTSALNEAIIQALSAADVIGNQSCDDVPIEGDADRPLILPYPIRVGQDWRYRFVEELNWEIRKVVRGWDKVTVGAGSFEVYKIEWYYVDGPRNIQINDEISARGMVRRTLQVDSVEIRDVTHPTGEGKYETWVEVLELDSLTN